MAYQFKLDPSSKKRKCPSCGEKTFVPYVHADSLEVVDSAAGYGRCDRENNCGYHKHPGEDKAQQSANKPSTVAKPEVVQIYPEDKVLKPLLSRTKKCVSPLHTYFKSRGISMDHMIKWGVLTDGPDDSRTVFLFRNQENRIVNLKWFGYQVDGHRNKKIKSYSLKQPPHTPPKKSSQKIDGQKSVVKKYFMCLFGEHLLDTEKERIVCIVESEKSAVMAASKYPDYDWVACGSASGLSDGSNDTADKITPLMNRTIYWLCDADKAGRSNSSIRNLAKYKMDYLVVDLAPEFQDGRDIGDLIDLGVHPDIEAAANVAAASRKQPLKEIIDEKPLYDLPKGCKWEDVKSDIITYGQFSHKNQIYIIKEVSKGGIASYFSRRISNFSVSPLGLIESKHDPRRLIEITNVFRSAKVLEVPTKAFASNTEFTVFVESEGNFQYNGQTQDLKKIRAKLYDTMTSFIEVDTLGWQDGVFIFANGIYNGKFHKINKYGFCNLEKKSYYIPPLSVVNQGDDEEWEDEKKFVYVKRTVKLKEWADLFVKVHKQNGAVSLMWYITSLFRDFIYSRYKFFPHLFLFGPPGTGKSQVGWSIRTMGFKGIKKPFNLSGGTKVSFHREFSHFRNFPAWFDEYDNSIDYDRVQSLKAAYDGAGHKKSVKDSDKRTKTVPVNSGCMISGQQLPIADNALFKRVILCQFHQTTFSDSEKDLFRQLQDMEAGGLSYITAGFMTLRETVEKNYVDTFEIVLKDLTEELNKTVPDLEDRIVRNMVMLVTMLNVLYTKIGKSLPFTYDEFRSIAIKNIKKQMSLIQNANEVNTFWDMVDYLLDQGLIEEDKDFKFRAHKEIKVSHGGEIHTRAFEKTITVLYLRTVRIIPLYREHFKRQNSGTSSAMDKGSLEHYLKNSTSYVGYIKSTRFETATSSAFMFDNDKLQQWGVNLKRGAKESEGTAELPV